MKKKSADAGHKLLWLPILALLILCTLTIFFSEHGAKLTGNLAIQTISYMKEGSHLDFEVRNIKGVKEITIKTSSEVKNAIIKFDQVENVNWNFTGMALSKFTIFSESEDKFASLKFLLRIQENELQQLGLSPYDVKLYHNGEELLTTLVEKKEGFFYYSAISSSMGDFVIGKSSQIEQTAEPIAKSITIPLEQENVTAESPKPVEQEPSPTKNLGLWQRILNFWRRIFS